MRTFNAVNEYLTVDPDGAGGEPVALIDWTPAGAVGAGTAEPLHHLRSASGSVVALTNAAGQAAIQWYNRPLRVESAYESYRDLRTRVTNKRTDTNVIFGQYDYRYDVAGRRKDVVYTGTAFAASHLFKWGYGDAAYNRGELTGADRHLGTDPDSPGARMTPGDYDYVYDHIGNREQYRLDADPPTTYTSNLLNQYTATDTLAGCPAPPTEGFCYDEDGNLTRDGKTSTNCGTEDGLHLYSWDAENRLIAVTPRTLSSGKKKVEFKYDYLNRRVEKKVSTWNGSAWTVSTHQKFVYDGWNPVLVISGSTTTKYTWGLDLSGTLQGAGGIGGFAADVVMHRDRSTPPPQPEGCWNVMRAAHELTGVYPWMNVWCRLAKALGIVPIRWSDPSWGRCRSRDKQRSSCSAS